MKSLYTHRRRHTQIHVHRAGPVGGLHVPMLTIKARHETPEFKGSDWETRYEAFYAAEALKLSEALINHLSMATIDRLLVHLLQHKATLLRPAFEKKVEP